MSATISACSECVNGGDLISIDESTVLEVLAGCGTATGLLGWSLFCGDGLGFTGVLWYDSVFACGRCCELETLSFGESEYGVLFAAGEAF